MTDPKQVYLVLDYWIDHDLKKVFAIYIREGILYFLEQELKK